MSTKNDILYNQIFKKFITGVTSDARIPSDSDVQERVDEINADDTKPIMNLEKFDMLNFEKLNAVFLGMIDDLDLLYSAIDSQSQNIMDQLTYSLKEYRGVKLALRKLKNEANDINNGKTGLDNIRYQYTEAFSDTNNINLKMSTIDELTSFPVIDIDAGQMYIPPNQLNLIDFHHYYGKKLGIIPSNYTGTIKSTRFIGEANASVMLDYLNDNRLEYELKTNEPTSMKLAFVLQLNSDNSKSEISGVAISVDSIKTKGHLRVEYKDDKGWTAIEGYVPTEKGQSLSPTMLIKDDNIVVSFNSVINTSHLKFSFIKEHPDQISDNIYYISINNLSVFKSTNSKTSILISKSTEIKAYANEDPVIGSIAAQLDGYLPESCYADVYVATDKVIAGHYISKDGNYVKPDSLNRFEFIKADIDTPLNRYSLLSDIIGQENISGVNMFSDLSYDWKLLKSFDSDDMKPEIINFVNLNRKDSYDNSISNHRSILFGDEYYTIELSGLYPQGDYPLLLDDWFTSGVINASNTEVWPYMSGAVDINEHLQDADYGTPISGFPFDWYNNTKMRTVKFGDYIDLIPGWSRPNSTDVTPSGILNSDGDIDGELNYDAPYPDFYMNGIKFYKVYRFEQNSEVIGSDINMYMYQTKPVDSKTDKNEFDSNDYYPHNMVWHYNDKYIPRRKFQSSYPTTNGQTDGSLLGSGIIKLDIPESGIYIEHSISDVHYDIENLYLDITRQYTVETDETISGVDVGTYVDLSPMWDDETYLPSSKVAFNYAYNEVNKYTSFWKGYVIVEEDSVDLVINQNISDSATAANKYKYNNRNIVNKYKIVNVATDEVITKNNNTEDSNYSILDDTNKVISLDRGIYEMTIHCLTADEGSYPANWWSPNSSEFIHVIGNARIVAEVKPLQIVSLETLLFTTTYDNDFRCGVMTDVDGLQYVVVKEPSKNVIPGYYFNTTSSAYIKKVEHLVQNVGHYKRKWLSPSGVNNINTYITGSEDSTIMSGVYSDTASYIKDDKWNDGKLYPQDFENSESGLYPQHSTFGNPLNIDVDYSTTDTNLGHIFYDTAENLAAFYTINYGLVDRTKTSINKFLYKIELTSEHESLSPMIDSIKFTMNTNLEEL